MLPKHFYLGLHSWEMLPTIVLYSAVKTVLKNITNSVIEAQMKMIYNFYGIY